VSRAARGPEPCETAILGLLDRCCYRKGSIPVPQDKFPGSPRQHTGTAVYSTRYWCAVEFISWVPGVVSCDVCCKCFVLVMRLVLYLLFIFVLIAFASSSCDLELRVIAEFGLGVFAGLHSSWEPEQLIQHTIGIPFPLSLLHWTILLHYVEGLNSTHALITSGLAMMFNHMPMKSHSMIRKKPSKSSGLYRYFYQQYNVSLDMQLLSNMYIDAGDQIFSHYRHDWFQARGLPQMEPQWFTLTSRQQSTAFLELGRQLPVTGSNDRETLPLLPGCASQLTRVRSVAHAEDRANVKAAVGGVVLEAAGFISAGQCIEVARALLLPHWALREEEKWSSSSGRERRTGAAGANEDGYEGFSGQQRQEQGHGTLALGELLWRRRPALIGAATTTTTTGTAGGHSASDPEASSRSSGGVGGSSSWCRSSYFGNGSKPGLSQRSDNYGTSPYRPAPHNSSSTEYAVFLTGNGALYGAGTTVRCPPREDLGRSGGADRSDRSSSSGVAPAVTVTRQKVNVGYRWWSVDELQHGGSRGNTHSLTHGCGTIGGKLSEEGNRTRTIGESRSHQQQQDGQCGLAMLVSFEALVDIQAGDPLVLDLVDVLLHVPVPVHHHHHQHIQHNQHHQTPFSLTRRRYVTEAFGAPCL
jgi:hypothetical protein